LGPLIFIDTSAIIAILAVEDDAERYVSSIERIENRLTGAHVRLECAMNLARILKVPVEDAHVIVDDFIRATSIRVVPIADSTSKEAVRAFARFGKGRGHPAQLNFGDCLSYACAREHGAPILFKGRDFVHTDLDIA
jgi:ribonuclease VapC